MSTDNSLQLPSISNKSVTQQVTHILAQLIIDKKVKHGDFLPSEDQLCQELGVSRTSIREAVKTLEAKGMVQKFRGKGIQVVDNSVNAVSSSIKMALKFNNTSMKDIWEFRNALEIKMAEFAAKRASQEQIENIHQNLIRMTEEEYSVEKFAELDFEFHKSIAQASCNNFFILMMETLHPMVYNQIAYTLEPDFNPEPTYHYHEMIYQAILEKDSKAAVKSMKSHLSGTGKIIEHLSKKKKLV